MFVSRTLDFWLQQTCRMVLYAALATALFCLLFGVSSARAHHPARNESEEVRLIGHLLKDYVKIVRPVKNDNTTINVTLDIAFNQLLDIDQQEQVMTSSVFIRAFWIDEYFTWDENEFNLNSIIIPPDTIWRPDITLYNHAHDEVSSLPVENLLKVNSSGHVRWLQPAIIKSQCTLYTLYFPFDVQTCKISLGSWIYHVGEVDVFPEHAIGDVTKFTPNGQWELEEMPVKRYVYTSRCCPGEEFSLLTYFAVLRRLPVYYGVNLFFPSVIMTFISLMVFYLPSASGEKTSFAVTMLLALTVFMLVAAEYLPDSSFEVPIISQYLAGTISLQCLIVFLTVFTLQVHHRGDYGVPPRNWLKRLAFDQLARFMCVSSFSRTNLKKSIKQRSLDGRRVSLAFAQVRDQPQFSLAARNGSNNSQGSDGEDENQPHGNGVTRQVSETESQLGLEYALLTTLMKEQVKDDSNREAIREEWSKIAAVLDRAFLFVFFIAALVLNVYPFARYYAERPSDRLIPETL